MSKLTTRTLTGNHGVKPFTVEAVLVGRLCVHKLLDYDPAVIGEDVYRVAHTKSLYALPGFYSSRRKAISAAREMDLLVDWDEVAADAPGAVTKGHAELHRRYQDIALRFGTLIVPLPEEGDDE